MKRGPGIRQVGLARALSKLGYCSRSQAAALIGAGRVRLNGATRKDPETPVRLVSDRIEVDSRVVRPQSKVYLMLNKPRGLVTTASDEKNRDTIYSCLSADLPWVAPVGRLDKASEGLILLTNDSEWAARISAPETHLDKIYHVQVGSVVNDELVARLVNGIDLESEGGARNVLRAKGARVVRTGERNAWLEVVLDEGKNRQIRRMCECVGVEVLRLVRISVGPLHLGQLAKGSFRRLSLEEKQLLDRAMRSGAGKQSK